MEENWQEKLGDIYQIYRIPLIFLGFGAFLILLGIIIFLRQYKTDSDIVFDIQSEATESGKIMIDIEGAVSKPGVYELVDGSRIVDALSISGGLTEDADREWIAKNMNKAAKLSDGAKIFIPKTGQTIIKSEIINSNKTTDTLGAGIVSGQVNINIATKAELEALSGIGPATAEKIIAARPFAAVEDLKNRKILNTSTYEKLQNTLTVY
jgi:competence protein ComEA